MWYVWLTAAGKAKFQAEFETEEEVLDFLRLLDGLDMQLEHLTVQDPACDVMDGKLALEMIRFSVL